MSDKDLKIRDNENKNTKRTNVKKGKKKRDTVVMVSIVFLVLLVVFGVYSILNINVHPSSEPSPLKEDESMRFEFNLTSDNKHTISVSPGESFTVTYKIYRTDADSDFVIHAVQDEIEYDSSVFELIEDSISCGYTVSIHDYDDDKCRIFMNTFAVTPEGFEYKQGAVFGSFTLKVKSDAASGSYDITNNNCEMSASKGYALYAFTVKDLTVTIVSE